MQGSQEAVCDQNSEQGGGHQGSVILHLLYAEVSLCPYVNIRQNGNRDMLLRMLLLLNSSAYMYNVHI